MENKPSEDMFLLIFPSMFTLCPKTLEQNIRKKISSCFLKIKHLSFNDPFLLIYSDDIVETASVLSRLSGISKIVIAERCSNDFRDTLNCILNISKQILSLGDTFCISVYNYNKGRLNYLGKDLETTAVAEILSLFFDLSVKPVTKRYASKVIDVYISDNCSYISLHIIKCDGGIPSGCFKDLNAGSLYDCLSAITLSLAIKAGMCPEILLFYSDEKCLRKNVSFFVNLMSRMPSTPPYLKIIEYDLSEFDKSFHHIILQRISIKILCNLDIDNVIVPLNSAFHDFWLVKDELNYILKFNKTPWLPLMMLNDDLFHLAASNGFNMKDLQSIPRTTLSKQYLDTIDQDLSKISLNLYKKIRIIKLQERSNYFHDILNSI